MTRKTGNQASDGSPAKEMTEATPVPISQLQEKLKVGTTFTATFLGKPVVVRGNLRDTEIPVPPASARRVVKQTTTEMVSEILDGPRAGELMYCAWDGVKAREEAGEITLSQTDEARDGPKTYDFVRISHTEHKEGL